MWAGDRKQGIFKARPKNHFYASYLPVGLHNALFLHRTDNFLMTINNGLTEISFPRWWRELKLRVIDLKEQRLMLLHFTSQETFNTKSGSVNEACKKKTVLDWIGHYKCT